MKRLLAILAVALMLPLAAIPGCAPGIKATKPSANAEKAPSPETEDVQKLGPAAPGDKGTEAPAVPSQPGKLSPEELEKMLPPPPPSYKRKTAEALPASPKELLEKEEINASALQFAKEIPDVKHIKTCFSKMFGGWYLHLYVTKGKKPYLQHYSWNPVTREWEVSMAMKDLPVDNVESHLKQEVGDEQCTVLK